MELVVTAEEPMLMKQMVATTAGLEEVTSPCKKQGGSINGKKKN